MRYCFRSEIKLRFSEMLIIINEISPTAITTASDLKSGKYDNVTLIAYIQQYESSQRVFFLENLN